MAEMLAFPGVVIDESEAAAVDMGSGTITPVMIPGGMVAGFVAFVFGHWHALECQAGDVGVFRLVACESRDDAEQAVRRAHRAVMAGPVDVR